jgi:biotin carboxylase
VVAGYRRDESAPARLLVLGAGPAQLGLLAAARNRGLYVLAVDRNPSAPGFRHADRRAIVSTEDEPAIERLAGAEQVDGIIAPGIDWPVAIAARIAERLSLPHPITPETAVLSTSKLRQRERFAERGVPQPRFIVCSGPDEAAAAGEEVGFPCVVKAPDRQGQRGLTLVTEPAQMRTAVDVALDASRSATLLVEEHVAGRELTVNGFSLAGRFRPLTVTDRVTADPPAFGVALAHVWPSDCEPSVIAGAIEAAGAAAAAVGVEVGPTYTQILVGEDGSVRVGELAARLGGGHDAELCRAVLGVDLNGLALAAALGDPISATELTPAAHAGGGCIRFLVAPGGRLESVSGLEEAFAIPGIKGIRVYRKPGHEFGPFVRGADRAGAILAVGDERGEALERAGRAAGLIRFHTSPVSGAAAAEDQTLNRV